MDDHITASEDVLDEQHNPVAQQFDTMMAASARAHRQEIMDKMQATNPAPAAPIATPVAPASFAASPIAPPAQPVAAQPVTPQNNYWFLNQPTQAVTTVPQDTVTFSTQIVAPGAPTSALPVVAATPTQDEESFIKNHDNIPAFSPNMHGHLHVIQPLSAQQGGATRQATTANPAMAQGDGDGVQNDQNTATPQVTRAHDTAILDLARNDDLNVATIAREAQKRQEPPQDEVVISLH
jgi:hypothetical protein